MWVCTECFFAEIKSVEDALANAEEYGTKWDMLKWAESRKSGAVYTFDYDYDTEDGFMEKCAWRCEACGTREKGDRYRLALANT